MPLSLGWGLAHGHLRPHSSGQSKSHSQAQSPWGGECVLRREGGDCEQRSRRSQYVTALTLFPKCPRCTPRVTPVHVATRSPAHAGRQAHGPQGCVLLPVTTNCAARESSGLSSYGPAWACPWVYPRSRSAGSESRMHLICKMNMSTRTSELGTVPLLRLPVWSGGSVSGSRCRALHASDWQCL